MEYTLIPKIGEIYAVKLPNNYYGTIRIMDVEDQTVLIATSSYFKKEKPSIDNVELLEILRQYRYYYGGDYALMNYEGKLPSSLELLGEIPLNKQEKKIYCTSFAEMSEEIGFEAYFEWAFKSGESINQKNIFKEDDKISEKNISLMDDIYFWSLIDKIKSIEIRESIHYLSCQSIDEIKQFEVTLAYKLYLLDTKLHAKNMLVKEDGYFSPDLFLYARCGVILQGKEVYDKVLMEPSLFTSDIICEELLEVASEAYSLKVGEELDLNLEYDYETGSNEDGWS